MRVLLIYRAPEYSPNNVVNDAAILDAVGEVLANAGSEQAWSIERCAETDLLECALDLEAYDFILHMARRLSTLMRLEPLRHPVVINAARGVRNVAKSRELTLMLLQAAGIAVPDWWAYDPEEDEMFLCEPHLQHLLPGWVKAMRTDGARPEDVTMAQTPMEADTRILDLAAQQVPDIVVTRHLEGDLIKCYCVVDLSNRPLASGEDKAGGTVRKSPFLRWFYPQESNYSKFGNAEQHNTPLARIPFAESELQQLAISIAQALDLQVFGFDAIVQASSDPLISVIDVNDWPTFGRCRAEAARAIAQLVIEI